MACREKLTSKVHVSRHSRQRCIDQFLEIHLFVLDVEQRLARSQARLAIPKGPRGIVAIQRLGVQDLEGQRNVVDRHRRPSRSTHEAESFDDNLANAILDILRESLESLVTHGANAHRLGDILDILGIPQQFGCFARHGAGRLGDAKLRLRSGFWWLAAFESDSRVDCR